VVLLVGCATFLGVALWTALAASRGHFSGDHGVKFAQSVALWRSDFSSRGLEVLADPALDPTGAYFPFGDLVRMHDGQRQGIYSILFTALGAPGIALLGTGGMLVLPLLGLGLALAGVVVAGRRLGLSPWLTSIGLLSVGLTTPLFFYAGQYQEHSLAAGLVTMAAALLVPDEGSNRQPAIAGVLLALAASIRPECYCALSAAGLIVVVQPALAPRRIVRDGIVFVGAALAVLAVYWVVNHLLSGTWDPLVTHNAHKVTPPRNDQKMLFGPFKGQPFIRPMVALHIAVYVALLPVHLLPAVARALVRTGVGLVLLGLSVWALRAQDDRTAVGLLSCTPLVAYGLLAGPWRPRLGALWLFALTFIVEVVFFDRSGTGGGLQFGARFLLPVVPVLVVLAMASFDEDLRSSSWVARVVAAAALVGFAVYGVKVTRAGYDKAMFITRGGEEATANARAAGGDVLITRRWWESQVMSPVLLDGKTILHVQHDPPKAFERLRDAGKTRFALLARGEQRTALRDGTIVKTVSRRVGWLEVHDMEIVRPPVPWPADGKGGTP
jgi:hypothetical protein